MEAVAQVLTQIIVKPSEILIFLKKLTVYIILSCFSMNTYFLVMGEVLLNSYGNTW